MIDKQTWDRLCVEADTKMKEDDGHTFVQMLKVRCIRCGRSPKQKGKCPYWLNRYMDILHTKVNAEIEEINNGNE